MKKIFLLSTAMMICLLAVAQTQKGISYRYNGKEQRTPLSNVTVDCSAANEFERQKQDLIAIGKREAQAKYDRASYEAELDKASPTPAKAPRIASHTLRFAKGKTYMPKPRPTIRKS